MTATFDGYLYVAENGAESDDGKWWFPADQKPGNHLPVRGMPSPIILIGGPRNGETVKRGCNAYDHEDHIEALMQDNWFKVRHDLDLDMTHKGQLDLARWLASEAVKDMEKTLDCASIDCALLVARIKIKSFVAEYYGAD